MPDPATHHAIEAIWKIESPKVIAITTRTLRGDLDLAEEVAQDAFLSALQQWPVHGIPDNPAAWLTAVAKHKAIDIVRRDKRFHLAHTELARDPKRHQAPLSREAEIQDDLLRLLFMSCHPILPEDARSALTLRLLCGLTTDEIARAFLTPEPTIAQRIVRAKKLLTEKQIPFEVPEGEELHERLSSVLQVIYLLFNEGYSATRGEDWLRPALCEDALRVGRILANLLPEEPEVHGLVALMELQASRIGARTDKDGRPILLLDQDRARWDQLLIRRGTAELQTCTKLASAPGPYELQARIAACHAEAREPHQTNWQKIAALYAALNILTPSPIIELNRAVAVSMAEGPAAGLAIIDKLKDDPALAKYHLLPSIRADLLFKLNRKHDAQAEFHRAASLTENVREKDLLLQRARNCTQN